MTEKYIQKDCVKISDRLEKHGFEKNVFKVFQSLKFKAEASLQICL